MNLHLGKLILRGKCLHFVYIVCWDRFVSPAPMLLHLILKFGFPSFSSHRYLITFIFCPLSFSAKKEKVSVNGTEYQIELLLSLAVKTMR